MVQAPNSLNGVEMVGVSIIDGGVCVCVCVVWIRYYSLETKLEWEGYREAQRHTLLSFRRAEMMKNVNLTLL